MWLMLYNNFRVYFVRFVKAVHWGLPKVNLWTLSKGHISPYVFELRTKRHNIPMVNLVYVLYGEAEEELFSFSLSPHSALTV